MTSLGFYFPVSTMNNQQRIIGTTTLEQTNDPASLVKINIKWKIQKRTQSSNSRLKTTRTTVQTVLRVKLILSHIRLLTYKVIHKKSGLYVGIVCTAEDTTQIVCVSKCKGEACSNLPQPEIWINNILLFQIDMFIIIIYFHSVNIKRCGIAISYFDFPEKCLNDIEWLHFYKAVRLFNVFD